MNSLSTYVFKGCEIRTIVNEDGIIEWVGKDVAAALGYRNPRKSIKDHCRPEGVTIRYIPDNTGVIQKTLCINEPNVFRLIARSKLPSAEKFERWIFEEVLPSIHHNGGYLRGQATSAQVDALVKAHDKEREKERHALIETIREQAYELSEVKHQNVQFSIAMEFVKPSVPFGELSQCNNKPRTQLVPSYFRATPGKNTNDLSDAFQLLLPLFNVIEGLKK